ncbi:spore cortex biosynthesis protein YabQ [Ammoniphilus resinae]|uniref:Spore cortex biosynthesis protein YabQ n=1 Tax=Ammoniphilus resinae TaxID=861532 RepID=A0ABS4GQG8_9BACL|nr:spore cortex biosynthesis protein YabQ [Ammoniphilus resinae]
MNIETQLVTMILMVACGVTMGLLYDTYRVMKGQTGMEGLLVLICDLLFWASCTFLVFGTLLRINEGIVRIYLFLGMGIGAWLYFVLFHTFYIKWFLRFIRLVKAIYRFVVRTIEILLVKPLIFLYKVVVAVIVAIALFIWRILLFIYQLFKKIFIPSGKYVKNLGGKALSSSKKKGAGFLKRLAKLFRRDKTKDE